MPASQRQIAKRLERLFSFMPGAFRDKSNFKTLVGAIAESDADLENLFLEVKKQLFVDTAEGQYLDMLGSNVGVQRPQLIGMTDPDFREFIKLQSYFPKQIKQLLFRFMELFYGRDTIKANIRSTAIGPYSIFDGANLRVRIDGDKVHEVTFKTSSFNDPSSVSSEEIAAQINSQVPDALFAATYFNAIDRLEFVELFTNTFGPVGSIEILGGSANRFLKFPDTLRLGTTINTQYRIVKQLTAVKLYWAGGDDPQFSLARVGDSVILTGSPFVTGNVGSFEIEQVSDNGTPAAILASTAAVFQSANVVRYLMPSTVNVEEGNDVTVSGFANASNNGTFTVLAVTPTYIELQSSRLNAADDEVAAGSVDLLPSASFVLFTNDNGSSQTAFGVSSIDDVLFFRPKKKKLESSKRPATVWEINSNEIVVTLPATPVVVRRNLAGSAHMQGTDAIIERAFSSSIELVNPEFFPTTSGRFYVQKPNGLILRDRAYTYGVKDGNTLISITPQIEPVGEKLSLGVGPAATSIGSNQITVSTLEPHGLALGELISVKNFNGFAGLTAEQLNGVRVVSAIIDSVTFRFTASASALATTTNSPSVNKCEIFTARGSKVILTNVQQNTGYIGSYIYDPTNALYTISNLQTTIQQEILLGEFGNSLAVFNSDVFPDSAGEVIINYGRQDEEGPIKYIAKPSTGTMFIDPSYRFKKSHPSGAAISLLRSRFATSVSSNGKEYPVYVVDTIGPREKLKELLLDAKAAGVSVRFIVVLPDNVYNAYSMYDL